MFGLLKSLWKDEDGAILTAEYLTLGGIVALGSAAGLAEVRNSVNDECKDYGMAVREINQASRSTAIAAVQPATHHSHASGQAAKTPAQREYQFMTP